MNIKFVYLYRDSGNNKNYGSVVYLNPSGERAAMAKQAILELTNDGLFSPTAIRIPHLYFEDFPYDPELDHPLHEFFELVDTEEEPDDLHRRSIRDVIEEAKLSREAFMLFQ